MSALLEIEELEVSFGGRTAAVRGASFRVEKGETHCLVGKSGCGKSVTALAVMSLLARGGHRSAKRMSFAGTDLLSLSDREMARLRGNRMAMIFQEPMTSLNPAFTIGSQMAEVLTRHKGGSRAAALDRAAELMGRVGITAPGMRLGQFPHQLSGGLRQRVMIAMALMCDPELLIADEPTTALDVTVQAQILRLLATLKRELGLSILLITHDLGIVARVADHVSVMYAGEVVERAPTAELFRAPQHPYTRGLLSCVPVPGRVQRDKPLGSIPGVVPAIGAGFAGCAFRSRCSHADETCAREIPRRSGGRSARLSLPARAAIRGAATRMTAAIEVQNLRCEFRVRTGLMSAEKRVVAVDDVTFSIPAGSVLGIVGESGCGKSTLARLILGLLKPTSGTVLVDGKRLFDLDRKARARLIQPVFQDPFASLNPRRRIKDIVALPLAAQGTFSRGEIERRVGKHSRARRPLGRDGRAHAGATLRRATPARGDCARAGARAADRDLRRADQRARRLGAGANPQSAGRSAPRSRADLPLHQPQSRGRGACRERSRRDVSRPFRRAQRDRRAVSRSRPPLYQGAAGKRADAGAGPGRAGHRPRRRHAGSGQYSPGCRFNPRCRIAVERCRHAAPTPMVRAPLGMVECHLA